jgi:hypothetical protein
MRRALILFSVTVLAVLAAGPASAADPDDPPPPEPVPIDLVTVNGSGCKLGTAHVTMGPDNKSFEISYDDYIAQSGGESLPTDFRKNCQLNLRIDAPPDYSYVITDVTHLGYASLAEGATGLVRNSYYFQGMSQGVWASHTFTGPRDDDWQTADNDVWVFAPCGEQRNLNINTEVRVRRGADKSALSFMTIATTGGDVRMRVGLAWRRC